MVLSLVGGCQMSNQSDGGGKQVIYDRLVVLTFDDGTVSQFQAGELVREYGFGATYFISDVDLKLETPKMNWSHIRQLHEMGFEIANHTCTHPDLTKKTRAQIHGELECLEQRCVAHQIPTPQTFAYPGYHDSPQVVDVLAKRGYRFARTGGSGPYDPGNDHPLRVPTCGNWGVPDNNRFPPPGNTLEYFANAVSQAKDGKIVVLTFHGIPRMDEPDNSLFKSYLDYLRDNKYTVIAMRDLAKYDASVKSSVRPYF